MKLGVWGQILWSHIHSKIKLPSSLTDCLWQFVIVQILMYFAEILSINSLIIRWNNVIYVKEIEQIVTYEGLTLSTCILSYEHAIVEQCSLWALELLIASLWTLFWLVHTEALLLSLVLPRCACMNENGFLVEIANSNHSLQSLPSWCWQQIRSTKTRCMYINPSNS